MHKRKILIVENSDGLRSSLKEVLSELGHQVIGESHRKEAIAREDLDEFDLIITDITDQEEPDLTSSSSEVESDPTIIKAFKMGAANYLKLPYNKQDLLEILDHTLSYKLRFEDSPSIVARVHEKIEFEVPSDLGLMNSVLQYLLDRVAKLGLIKPERSNLYVALDEAFVNAVKHGNKNDPTKLVRITAELTPQEACFTVEDEGEGFNVQDIPDPCDPANLFKTSGRGVLLIYNIMDEVEYNAQGNRVKMVKRTEGTPEAQIVEPVTSDDNHASSN